MSTKTLGVALGHWWRFECRNIGRRRITGRRSRLRPPTAVLHREPGPGRRARRLLCPVSDPQPVLHQGRPHPASHSGQGRRRQGPYDQGRAGRRCGRAHREPGARPRHRQLLQGLQGSSGRPPSPPTPGSATSSPGPESISRTLAPAAGSNPSTPSLRTPTPPRSSCATPARTPSGSTSTATSSYTHLSRRDHGNRPRPLPGDRRKARHRRWPLHPARREHCRLRDRPVQPRPCPRHRPGPGLRRLHRRQRGRRWATPSPWTAPATPMSPGHTNSDRSDLPRDRRPGSDLQRRTVDAFVAKVNAAGTALVYAGYIGGGGYDRATASPWTAPATPT